MFSLRNLFPSFEKPVERPRYLNLEPARRRDFRGIGTVLGVAVIFGAGFAFWQSANAPSASLAVAAVQSRPAAIAAGKPAVAVETQAAAVTEEDVPAPTVKLSTICAQRKTARRDCASVRAFKEARLNAPEPAAQAAAPAPAAAKSAKPESAAVPAKPDETAVAGVNTRAEAPAPQRPAAVAPKPKKPRVDPDAPVERLVRVYDHIMPDGRRVPVYQRAGGGYETGTIVDGEYRPSRRANLEPPYDRRFGLQ